MIDDPTVVHGDEKHRLILLPGLGADRRLLSDQAHAFPTLTVPDWIEPRDGESLRDYAARYAPVLTRSADRRYGFWIGGFSFGGQVAIEVARALVAADNHAGLRGILLIASNRSPASILPRFRKQAALGTRVPAWLARPIIRAVAGPFAKANGLDTEQTTTLRNMARDADLAMLTWGGLAAARWDFDGDFSQLNSAGIAIHQIHGEADRVIPLNGQPADEIIPAEHGGRHLITWTAADRVNDWIARTTGITI